VFFKVVLELEAIEVGQRRTRHLNLTLNGGLWVKEKIKQVSRFHVVSQIAGTPGTVGNNEMFCLFLSSLGPFSCQIRLLAGHCPTLSTAHGFSSMVWHLLNIQGNTIDEMAYRLV
jgi:hypothetical protein